MDLLRHVRLPLIWGLWSVAWMLMLAGMLDDPRFLAWGVFVGLGATVAVIWELIERERVTVEEMADGLARAAQRRDGPRGL